ncbi:MAG: DegT/DnrJ/EryC1/StrS family aminotransferase [Elusimicrobia bacterium CG_4_9_14_3_um_filter_62_55]|nr:MAG: aminotransferase DegT [Elusimicrobia bacterium CG22_combo_CG10-13_8_21_14_all_63_91]PJB24382.1 MAG: DegT/DnrJ/EryC1/StrS family aminotransferase [Elusimicrobia bacterium CG_4_9_14_3_um_filter_62_55]
MTQSTDAPARFRVPFVDPRKAYRDYKDEIDAAIADCLENGDLIHRRQLFDFERDLAAYTGARYAVGLASGYHALFFALLAAKVGPGDEVVTVAHTFAASISAIVHTGATPVLVDVADDFNMNVDAFEAALTEKTKAVIPVHLNGRSCDMERIMKIADARGIAVIEDACQALGATFRGKMCGSFATGCFSFYPFKALGCYGDGGALITDDEAVAKMAVRLRYNGEDRQTGEFHYHGYSALLDNLHASVLGAKLRHFPAWVEHRRALADRYRAGLVGVPGLGLPHFEGAEYRDSYQNYAIRSDRRDDLRAHLSKSGIETIVSWAKPVWEHKALGLGSPDLPETLRICRAVLSLPMSSETTPEQVDLVIDAIRSFPR